MKKYSFLIITLFFAFTAMSQKPIITFQEKEYNFGKINEADGNVTHIFNFSNTGKATLVVSRVQTECGCTTPTWSKEPIEPKKKGNITVTYSTANRPGAFTKPITVYSNDSIEKTTLIIKGEVIPKAVSK